MWSNVSIHNHHNEHIHGKQTSTGYQVCQILLVAFTVVGNLLLTLSLTVRLAKLNFLDRLMLNLVFCNLLLVLLSVPTSMEIERADVFPFRTVGCKLIYPVCTYVMNTCVFTYVAIAWGRWVVVSKLKSIPIS